MMKIKNKKIIAIIPARGNSKEGGPFPELSVRNNLQYDKLSKRSLYLLCHISVPLYFLYKIPLIGNIGKMLFVIPVTLHWG